MPTNTEPVQLDAFPKEWSSSAADRVLDAAVQRVLRAERPAAAPAQPAPARPAVSDDCCLTAWAFGPGGGRA